MSSETASGVTVEFFGIARRRAGTTRTVVCHGGESSRLGDVLLAAAEASPVRRSAAPRLGQ